MILAEWSASKALWGTGDFVFEQIEQFLARACESERPARNVPEQRDEDAGHGRRDR